jgi:hypothetical protein
MLFRHIQIFVVFFFSFFQLNQNTRAKLVPQVVHVKQFHESVAQRVLYIARAEMFGD